jgi:hypothetical protein
MQPSAWQQQACTRLQTHHKPGVIAMKFATSIVPGILIALLIATQAQAVPLDYRESVAGDLTFPAPAFTLDAGINTISGNTHFNVNSPGLPRFDTDFDSFAFEIPTGLQLVSLSLSFLTTTFNVAAANLELRLCSGVSACGLDPIELLGAQQVDLLGPSPQAVDFGLPLSLSSGTFSIFTAGLGIGVANTSITQASWATDYAWTVALQRVSEPGVVELLMLGFAALLWSCRASLAPR